MVCSVSFFVGH